MTARFKQYRFFGSKQLKELSKPYPNRMLKCLTEKNDEKAIKLCEEMSESRVLLHDYFADSCTVLRFRSLQG